MSDEWRNGGGQPSASTSSSANNDPTEAFWAGDFEPSSTYSDDSGSFAGGSSSFVGGSSSFGSGSSALDSYNAAKAASSGSGDVTASLPTTGATDGYGYPMPYDTASSLPSADPYTSTGYDPGTGQYTADGYAQGPTWQYAGAQSQPSGPPAGVPPQNLYQPQPYPAQPYSAQNYPAQPYGAGGYQSATYNPYLYSGSVNPGMLLVPAPHGFEPSTGLPYSDKSKTVAGLLQIFLGGLGVGRFYKGDIGLGVAQLLVCMIFGWWLFLPLLWPFIDGIVMLSTRQLDSDGRPMRT